MNKEHIEITEKQNSTDIERIINGKIYNTKVAKWVAGWDYGNKEIVGREPAYIYNEDLYITPIKNWFLDTTMRDRDDMGNYFTTRDLLEITSTQAMLWLSDHRLNETAKKYFGDQLVTA